MKNHPADEGWRWLTQAKLDLGDAQYLYKGGRYNTCCFLCQQAAEKAIKAYLYRQGAEHIYSHSVAELCQEASKINKSFKDIKIDLSPLDVFYIPTRYPNALPGGIPSEAFSRKDAERALAMAEKAISFIETMLG